MSLDKTDQSSLLTEIYPRVGEIIERKTMKTAASYEVIKIRHERGEMCPIRSLERESSHIKVPSNDSIASYK